MCVKIMRKVWKQALKPTPKYVLLALADYANENGECYPGQQDIADRTGLTKRCVIAAISELIQAGYVTVKKTAGNKNRYVVSGEPNSLPTSEADSLPNQCTTFTSEADSPVNDVHNGSEAGSLQKCTTFTSIINKVLTTNEPPVNHHDTGESENTAETAAKKPEKRKQHDPAVVALAERFAECRRADAGMVKVTQAAIDYYADLLAGILLKGETTLQDLTILTAWFETPEGMESFRHGIGNTPKGGYTHALVRNLAMYLSKAKGKSYQPGRVKQQDMDFDRGYDLPVIRSEDAN